MELNQPFAAITPTLDGAALSVLARTTRPMTVPAVVSAAHCGSEAGMRKALRRLCGQGVVVRERTGHHDSYVLNRRHLLAPAIESIAQADVELRTRLAGEVAGWDVVPVYVALFGSAAYGVMNSTSDVDVFVVRSDDVAADDPGWVDQLMRLSESGRAWTGNDVRVLELSESEVGSALAAGEPVLADVDSRGYSLMGRLPAPTGEASR